MQQPFGAGPDVAVEQESERAGASSFEWFVTWRVRNRAPHALKLLSARLPHGRFRCEERILHPPQELRPGDSMSIELPAACDVRDGSPVENAFIILRSQFRDEAWLILVRLRVEFDERGAPKAETEVITTQPIGFSRDLGENSDKQD